MDNWNSAQSDATDRNCETCGLLLGTLADDVFTIKVLLVPKQCIMGSIILIMEEE